MKMFQKNKIIYIPFLFLLFVLLSSGCMNILAEDLYSLPRLTDEYLRLQAKIDEVLEKGALLSPPTAGIAGQVIQKKDLTGSGINEVVVFFSLPDEGLLNLYIFAYENGDYTLAEIIEFGGIQFESVRFADMDGDGIKEIAVGWQVSPMLRQMEIFSIVGFNATSLIQTNYIDFIDFDLTGDGNNDVVAIVPTAGEQGMVVSLYSLMSSGELIMSSAELMTDVVAYIQILTGRLIDDMPAVFVESEVWTDEGYQIDTEIFIFYDEDLTKTTLNRERNGNR